jgi:hypothetical protein
MSWPRIGDDIYTDRVKARVVTWETKDRAGGRVPSYGAWSATTHRCLVTAVGVAEAPTSASQSVVTHCVTADVRIANLRDQLQWQETAGILTITGIEPAGDANGRIWNHYASEFLSQ